MINTAVKTNESITATASSVWAKIRDFNSLPLWHPLVMDSEILEGKTGSCVGAVRRFTQKGGISVKEKLLALDDHKFCITYLLLEAPLPVENYISTIKLRDVPNTKHCVMTWDVSYSCAPEDAERLNRELENVFRDGFSSLNEIFDARV